jgi:hypothetical protein
MVMVEERCRYEKRKPLTCLPIVADAGEWEVVAGCRWASRSWSGVVLSVVAVGLRRHRKRRTTDGTDGT